MTKLIIIAAGTGSRMGKYTAKTPKPLIEIDKGVSIMDAALEQIKKSKVIDEVIFVVGYLAEQIEERVKTIKGIKVRTIYNPYYKTSGNLFSLWFAYNEMQDEDIMVTNADNIIDASVWKKLSKTKGINFVLCENDDMKADDMKVIVDGDEVVEVSKDIEPIDGTMESVSLVKISKEKLNDFKSVFNRMIREENRNGDKRYIYDYWPTIFYQLFKEGILVQPLKIEKKLWHEVDYHGDLMDLIKLRK